MKKKETIKIDVNEIALNTRKFDSNEIGRGIGIQRPKKGKGSYTRKEKHKKRNGLKDCDHSFFYAFNLKFMN